MALLTSHHLATAHLHSGQLRLRTRHLAGLNGSVIAAAAFDDQIPHRAYAVTNDLDLLLLQVPDTHSRAAQVSYPYASISLQLLLLLRVCALCL